MSTPTFFENGYPIRAAGIVPFAYVNGLLYYLLVEDTEKGHVEDLGGKNDVCDRDVKDVAIRECWEETYGYLRFEKDMLTIKHYNEKAKYITYFCRVKYFDIECITRYEEQIGTPKKLCWVYEGNLRYVKLHPRFEWFREIAVGNTGGIIVKL